MYVTVVTWLCSVGALFMLTFAILKGTHLFYPAWSRARVLHGTLAVLYGVVPIGMCNCKRVVFSQPVLSFLTPAVGFVFGMRLLLLHWSHHEFLTGDFVSFYVNLTTLAQREMDWPGSSNQKLKAQVAGSNIASEAFFPQFYNAPNECETAPFWIIALRRAVMSISGYALFFAFLLLLLPKNGRSGCQ